MNIVLIGFMGSGKSVVAKRLSQLMHHPCIEMDDLVYQKTNTRNMNEVFALGGELLLRETEIAIAKEVASKDHLILSTGGGVVLNKIILDYFKIKGGKIVFLNARFETIFERIGKEGARPLFQQIDVAKKLYEFRLPLYLYYADEVIDVDDLSVDEVARMVKSLCG